MISFCQKILLILWCFCIMKLYSFSRDFTTLNYITLFFFFLVLSIRAEYTQQDINHTWNKNTHRKFMIFVNCVLNLFSHIHHIFSAVFFKITFMNCVLSFILDRHLSRWRSHRFRWWSSWHVDSSSASRSIRHLLRISTRHAWARYFLWQQL